ncbi:hypothetical protein [Paenibacillus chitinolyticus]|uniref:hypothetical protein n=1 Tax=Paenibacillus chitinolyticus TaxID=79263 RepID=UPI00366A62C9
MTNLTRKILSLDELKYAWLLVLSIVICIATFFIDEHFDPNNQLGLTLSYFSSFLLAAIWGGVNYVGHIRTNSLYKKKNDIHAYVSQLALSRDDKTELQNYLEDFAADLELKGMKKEEAEKEAINQFRAKEFLSMSKYTSPFESHGHHYLIGYALISITLAVVIALIERTIASPSLFFLIMITIFAVYGISLGALFMVYRVLDKLIYKKLKDYFS